jgi:hypothetical protein
MKEFEGLFETRKMRICDLIPNKQNPRKIKQLEKAKLWERLQKFGFIGIPVLDANGVLLSGHQRCQVFIDYGFGDLEIDVRVAIRKLSDEELKEVMIIENYHSGEFDLQLLHDQFADFVDLEDFGIDMAELTKDLPSENITDSNEPEMPIVPKYSEKHSAVVIVIDNSIDENFVRECLGLGNAKDYKTSNVAPSYVLTAKQFTERWKEK